MTIIGVSAALLSDPTGRLLLVRKHGTTAYMQPGGKPEAGETPLATTIREVHEELGLLVPIARWQPLGEFRAAAANEPGHQVVAQTFAVVLTETEAAAARPSAEIAEAIWVTPEQARALDLAPLTREALLPLLASD